MGELSLIDRKLLTVLSKDVRLSQSQIGSIIGVSRDVVAYRIKKLEDDGLIKGYIGNVSNRYVGLEDYYFSIKLQNCGLDQEKSLIKKIVKIDPVKQLYRTRGIHDIIILVSSKSKIHLSKTYDSIVNYCGKYLNEIDTEIYVKNLKSDELSFLVYDFNFRNEKVRKSKTKYKLDNIDKQIIKTVCGDGKIPLNLLAEKISMTPENTSVRLKKLFDNNVIVNTQAKINFNKLGFDKYIVYLKMNQNSRQSELELKELFRRESNVTKVDRVIGKWDFKLNFVSKNHHIFLKNIEIMKEYLGRDLNYLSYSLVLNEVKRKPYFG